MIVALADTKTGRQMLIVGLTDENIARLTAGQPVQLSLDTNGLNIAPIDVVIAHDRTEAALIRLLGPLTSNDTVVHDIPADPHQKAH